MRFFSLVSSLSVVLISFSVSTFAQGNSRGMDISTDLESADRSIKLELIVEEIEDAGFTLDVEEGFEEEWEEEIWISSDGDFDLSPLTALEKDASNNIEDPSNDTEENWEEIVWGEESFEDLDTDFSTSEEDQEFALEEEDFDELFLLETDLFDQEGTEEAFDPGWEEVMDEMEFEEMEFEMEDDLDLLEELSLLN